MRRVHIAMMTALILLLSIVVPRSADADAVSPASAPPTTAIVVTGELGSAPLGPDILVRRAVPTLGFERLEVATPAVDRVLAALRARGLDARRDHPVTSATSPDDPLYPSQWAHPRIRTESAWARSVGATSTVIAVLDTGILEDHQDLRGAVVPGWNFVADNADYGDDHFATHGTSVSGVAVARTDNGEGIAGTCWKCSVMPLKVLDSAGSGTASVVAEAIVYAADHGADIINMSLGGPDRDPLVEAAVIYAAERGVLLVAAAGNAGTSTPVYPAAFTDVIAVGATNATDARFSFSNHGPWVSVAAPGCAVTTVSLAYGEFCGTSAAAPFVAGTAGLIRSLHPDLSVAEVRSLIEDGAVPIGSWVAHGRIDAANAVQTTSTPPPDLSAGTPIVGDFDGDGSADLGWYLDGQIGLQLSPSQVVRFTYGRRGDIPVVGDWDADGIDTLGVIRDGAWHLINSHRSGGSDVSFVYGRIGPRGHDVPLVGDWDGNGRDDIGIVRDGEWHLRTTLSGGPGQIVFTYGRVGPRGDDVPLIGDWDRDGKDTVGIVRDGEWHLLNKLAGGAAQIRFTYGRVTQGDRPVTGDWDRDERTTAGIIRGSTWYLRDANTSGPADRIGTFAG